MATTKITYAGRLPYGLWFDPETGMETLFDRGYQAIAQRPVDQPEAATLVLPRRHISAPVEVWFDTGSASQEVCKTAETRCETIFARFMLGCDVRGLVEKDTRGQAHTGRGNYLPRRPGNVGPILDRLERGPT